MARYHIVTADYHPAKLIASKLATLLNHHQSSQQEFDYLLIIGGDGTIINYAKKYCLVPQLKIIGINAGKVGFFSSFNPHNLKAVVNLIDEKNTTNYFRCFPLIHFQQETKEGYCFNDLLITHTQILNASVAINNYHFENYRGSSLLFSTQNGSTGLNKSAHGPIIFPQNNCWIINELLPQNTKHFNSINNPLILPTNAQITITNHNPWQPVQIITDGKQFQQQLKQKLTLRLINSQATIYLPSQITNYLQKLQQIFLITQQKP